jgi:hypothetical protein
LAVLGLTLALIFLPAAFVLALSMAASSLVGIAGGILIVLFVLSFTVLPNYMESNFIGITGPPREGASQVVQ